MAVISAVFLKAGQQNGLSSCPGTAHLCQQQTGCTLWPGLRGCPQPPSWGCPQTGPGSGCCARSPCPARSSRRWSGSPAGEGVPQSHPGRYGQTYAPAQPQGVTRVRPSLVYCPGALARDRVERSLAQACVCRRAWGGWGVRRSQTCPCTAGEQLQQSQLGGRQGQLYYLKGERRPPPPAKQTHHDVLNRSMSLSCGMPLFNPGLPSFYKAAARRPVQQVSQPAPPWRGVSVRLPACSLLMSI